MPLGLTTILNKFIAKMETTNSPTTSNANEWTPEEDDHFMKQIQICGTHNWKVIADQFPGKSAKHCRLRWHNHLNPEIKRTTWSPDEDRILLQYQHQIGNKWARIAKVLRGRTDNQVKNRYYSLTRPNLYKRPAEEIYMETAKHVYPHLPPKYLYNPELNQSLHSYNTIQSNDTSSAEYSPYKRTKHDQPTSQYSPHQIRTVSHDNDNQFDLSFLLENPNKANFYHNVSNPESPVAKTSWNSSQPYSDFSSFDQHHDSSSYIPIDYIHEDSQVHLKPVIGHSYSFYDEQRH